ncbi:hypothetical protein VPNG_06736 [Cytospora leucostoma]|uniref:Myb-like domain-containing protein n=1 Tax=Cytospora leucostoma TaxID=1230097 RepID=A0A423WT40_9PEZI|nr:hypothetical protein VPNG_06736 [Cytospora leucostoma]
MDHQHLSAIATDAIEHTLRYHLERVAHLSEEDRTLISDSIQEVFSLREHAEDIHVAHLEIACDAAISFAENFNEKVSESQRINLRWFYTCVQSLLTIELKPELLEDGQVDRLPLPNEQIDTESGIDASSPCSSSAKHDAPLRETSAERSVTADDEPAVAMKDARAPWEEDELRQLIQLKDSGLRHREIARRLGRTQSAVENKYGRLMKAAGKRPSRAAKTPQVNPSPERTHVEEEDVGQSSTSGKEACSGV